MLLVAAVAPFALRRLRKARWQRAAGVLAATPFAIVIWAFGMTAQEFKFERGSYPTVFDLAEGASSAVFMKGAVGFLRYNVVWIPGLLFSLAGSALLASRVFRPRRDVAVVAWRPWTFGVALSLALGTAFLRLIASAEGRFGAAAVGDPFQAIVDSSFDVMAYGGKATARDLVRDSKTPHGDGPSLLGWPPARVTPANSTQQCVHHPYERPLDRAEEPVIREARSEALLAGFEGISRALFPLDDNDNNIIVWQLTLESFRGDDVHALHADAGRDIAPFVNGLYEAAARGGNEGVLASRAMYQAGVRTAHGLGALTCGLGTLPYNVAIIRDLHPFRVRCLSDVLADSGFRASFYYGSDMKFDQMVDFFGAHRFAEQVSQADLPKDAPTGAWDAVSDFALIDETAKRVAAAPNNVPRFVMLTTLSNHSPFPRPGDLPAEVEARVDRVLASVTNHADRDDRPRLLTYSYTDLAVARFFARLEEQKLAARSIVVLAADHSTGESYVWGAHGDESDDAKGRIPFAIVLPNALRDRAHDRPALDAALTGAQRSIEAGPLSQNDVPSLMLALLRAHPAIQSLPKAARWHTLGGQVTSPWFRPPPIKNAYIMGINGVSQFLALDHASKRIGEYEESSFLKTRGDLSAVTPSLIPITETLSSILRADPIDPCPPSSNTSP